MYKVGKDVSVYKETIKNDSIQHKLARQSSYAKHTPWKKAHMVMHMHTGLK